MQKLTGTCITEKYQVNDVGYWCYRSLRQIVVTGNVLTVRSFVKICGRCCFVSVETGFFCGLKLKYVCRNLKVVL